MNSLIIGENWCISPPRGVLLGHCPAIDPVIRVRMEYVPQRPTQDATGPVMQMLHSSNSKEIIVQLQHSR